jgi:DNA gyrase/topoisomerase IV subunit A
VQVSNSRKNKREERILLHEEVEKRYLAYALSTIVSRALPDVRDGLKPVHRRILYAMQTMGLGEAAKMRKSAAVVGEVIGKYHPHGDQAAYDALVRMAQDFSLRYPLIEGSGNFGSVDGDSPAAMRYTETRLSGFAGSLLREIDQGTTEFHPTYDGMGKEPDVLPSLVPNLLVNGSSGIAVGMSCSFPPHNLTEVVRASRAMIKDPNLGIHGLFRFIKGPDFPTGGEILDQPATLEKIYASGHGSVRLRGTFETEERGRGATNLVITSIPYSVNKSRLIERIANLIRDKKLKTVHDIRDESTEDVRIVIELRGGDVRPDSVMAFLYKHTDLQINFLLNFIAITPEGVPERLGLDRIIRHFLEFRFEKTTLRLQHRLAILRKRIHILEGFDILFRDLDRALKIIRSARSRNEAEEGLTEAFRLDKEQVDAILEMRLYKLVSLEMGKLLDELADKKREAAAIERDLASPQRIWSTVDKDLAEIDNKFGDERRTAFVGEIEASALEFDPNEFVEHEDVSVILSQQGWIRRMKMEIDDISALKFREGDGLLGWARVNTERTVALFSNLGKVYIIRALDIPATSGFGEPLGSLLSLADGEAIITMIVPDPAALTTEKSEAAAHEDARDPEDQDQQYDSPQGLLFEELRKTPSRPEEPAPEEQSPQTGVVITRGAHGFRFDYEILREPTKRIGKKLVNLREGDEVFAVRPVDGELVAVAVDSGRLLLFPLDQVSSMAGPAQGVRMIRLDAEESVKAMEIVTYTDILAVQLKKGKEKIVAIPDLNVANRATRGKKFASGIRKMYRMARPEGRVQ